MRLVFLAAACLAVTACAPQAPIVTGYNGDSVTLQQASPLAPAARTPAADAEAARICAKGSKKRAEYASSHQLPQYITEHLYLCL